MQLLKTQEELEILDEGVVLVCVMQLLKTQEELEIFDEGVVLDCWCV